MKIVVTGAAGMLGKDVVDVLSKEKKLEIFPTDITPLSHPNAFIVDLTDKADTLAALNKIHPDIIVHCAAIADVDLCEKKPDLAFKVHVNATENLAEYSNGRSKLIYISTDSVYFDNSKGTFTETDRTNPINVYAKTKLQGEDVALRTNKNTFVLRTNIYGFPNRPKTQFLFDGALAKLHNNEVIKGYKNIFFNPLYTKQLAMIISKLMIGKGTGVINVGAKEKISKYEILLKFADVFGLDKTKIIGEDAKFATIRPENTTMNTDKLQKLIGTLPSITDGLLLMKKDYDRTHKQK
jgi:dTDP-4-dehydrorhamnose reductase